MDYKEIIVILEAIKGNVWLMTFALLWGGMVFKRIHAT